MRFDRGHRFEFTDTPRKRSAVLIRQRKDREKLPLFGPLIAEEQPSVDEVMTSREANWRQSVASTRAERARKWREGRARLNRLPEPLRSAFLRYWNQHRWLPGDPGYLLGELHSLDVGRLVLHEDRIRSQHDIDWEAKRDAKIAAMTDAELDHMIQTHISMMFVDLGRAERLRRQEARA